MIASPPEKAFKLQNEDTDIEPEERLAIDQMKRVAQIVIGGNKNDDEYGGSRKNRKAAGVDDEEEDG